METKKISIDTILSEKVKMGRAQYWAVLAVGFLWMSDGSELFLIGFTMPLIKSEWGIMNGKEGYLGSLVFFGVLLGNILSGVYSDRIGRKEPFILGSLLIMLSSFLSAISGSFIQLLVFRFFFGIGMGLTVPLIPTYLSEIIPKSVRGKYIVFSGTAFPFGECFVLFIIWLTFNSFDDGSWRVLVFLAAIPSLLAVLILLAKTMNSPRFLLIMKSNIDRSVQILDWLGETNDPLGYQKITEEEKEGLVLYAKEIQEINSTSSEISELFKP